MLLLLAFCSAMIWVGTWIGLIVRTPDAVMGVGFTIVFPLTFISNAFVPLESLPKVLRFVAAWNPVSVVVAAIRQLFGNPSAPLTTHSWPLEHAPIAAFLYCGLVLAVTVPASLRRYPRAQPTEAATSRPATHSAANSQRRQLTAPATDRGGLRGLRELLDEIAHEPRGSHERRPELSAARSRRVRGGRSRDGAGSGRATRARPVHPRRRRP